MTLVLAENIKFNSWRVKQEICREFMACILAYQKERHEFHLKRVLTPLQHVLPIKAVAQARPIGDLEKTTGILIVNPAIKEIIKRYKVWSEFSLNAH